MSTRKLASLKNLHARFCFRSSSLRAARSLLLRLPITSQLDLVTSQHQQHPNPLPHHLHHSPSPPPPPTRFLPSSLLHQPCPSRVAHSSRESYSTLALGNKCLGESSRRERCSTRARGQSSSCTRVAFGFSPEGSRTHSLGFGKFLCARPLQALAKGRGNLKRGRDTAQACGSCAAVARAGGGALC